LCEALAIERAQLQALPGGAPATTASRSSSVTTSATIEVKRVLYSVPARLIGERLRLHVFDDRIEAFVGATKALTLPRVYSVNHERARRIDYRHLIGALVRKPQAFRYSQLREDLLPNATYRTIWQHLDRHLKHARRANASSASSPWPPAPTANRPWARICWSASPPAPAHPARAGKPFRGPRRRRTAGRSAQPAQHPARALKLRPPPARARPLHGGALTWSRPPHCR
jgi:hypothetical protein